MIILITNLTFKTDHLKILYFTILNFYCIFAKDKHD